MGSIKLSTPVQDYTGERLVTEICNANTVEHLHRYALAMSMCKDLDILDIASGEGYGSNLLAGLAKSVTGVDISEKIVEHAKKKYQKTNLKFIRGHAEEIPLETASVDAVVSFETIEHHDKHEEMFLEIKRVLRPNGFLLMSTPDKNNFQDDTNVFHVKELTLEEFSSLARRYFKNVHIFSQKISYGSLIAPGNSTGFVHYSGHYYQIEAAAALDLPSYNLCLASDDRLPYFPVSFFDGLAILEKLVDSYRNSVSLRLGLFLTWPLRIIYDFIANKFIKKNNVL